MQRVLLQTKGSPVTGLQVMEEVVCGEGEKLKERKLRSENGNPAVENSETKQFLVKTRSSKGVGGGE